MTHLWSVLLTRMEPESSIAGVLPGVVKCSCCANKSCEICLAVFFSPRVPTPSKKGSILKALGKTEHWPWWIQIHKKFENTIKRPFFSKELYFFFFLLCTRFYSLLNENTPFSRYTIYSPKDGQPCMDHDRQTGEVMFLLDTLMHCLWS